MRTWICRIGFVLVLAAIATSFKVMLWSMRVSLWAAGSDEWTFTVARGVASVHRAQTTQNAAPAEANAETFWYFAMQPPEPADGGRQYLGFWYGSGGGSSARLHDLSIPLWPLLLPLAWRGWFKRRSQPRGFSVSAMKNPRLGGGGGGEPRTGETSQGLD